MSLIDDCMAKCPWKVGDKVRVKNSGESGTVAYIYWNGWVLLSFEHRECVGGIFSNDSSYRWGDVEKVEVTP